MSVLRPLEKAGPSDRARDATTTSLPPLDEAPAFRSPPRRRRHLVILLSALGSLAIAIPVLLWALVDSEYPTGTAPPAATNPAVAAPTAPATAPGGPPGPVASAPVEAGGVGLPGRYKAVRLPRLAGFTQYGTWGHALNDKGQAVGQSEAANGRPHPVLWENGRVVDLGVLSTGPDEVGVAFDINNQGDIVGSSHGPNGQRAALWRDGQIIDLGTLGGDLSSAVAVNDRGQIVGHSATATGEVHGFLWENGRMRDLGIPGETYPRDINNLGQVVGGSSFGQAGANHAFLWRDGAVTRLEAPGRSSGANAINDRGEVVGSYMIEIEMGSRPVRWYHGTRTVLGVLLDGDAGGARAINERGQIVGTSNIAPHSMEEHPFIWWRGEMHDLTAAGVRDESAYVLVAINNRGQILAGDTLYNPA